MKITLETLDKGVLVTWEDYAVTPAEFQRLAYDTALEALEAIARAMAVPVAHPIVYQDAPVAPAPEPEPEEPTEAPAEPRPATRRIGLMQPKKSAAPAGRRA